MNGESVRSPYIVPSGCVTLCFGHFFFFYCGQYLLYRKCSHSNKYIHIYTSWLGAVQSPFVCGSNGSFTFC